MAAAAVMATVEAMLTDKTMVREATVTTFEEFVDANFPETLCDECSAFIVGSIGSGVLAMIRPGSYYKVFVCIFEAYDIIFHPGQFLLSIYRGQTSSCGNSMYTGFLFPFQGCILEKVKMLWRFQYILSKKEDVYLLALQCG